MKKIFKKKKGFTLVELLGVIVILAIISAVTVPTVLTSMNRSKEKAFNASIKAIQKYIDNQVENCKMENKSMEYEESLFEEGTCNLLYNDDETKNRIIELAGYKNQIDEITLDNDYVINEAKGTGQLKNFALLKYDDSCWTIEGSKLTNFNGIDHSTGDINELCTGYVQKDENNLYSIFIPSEVDNKKITTLGNRLFSSIFMEQSSEEFIYNTNYSRIKSIKIENGITTIEDGCSDAYEGDITGTFMYIGYDFYNLDDEGNPTLLTDVQIKLPNSINSIGNSAFDGSNIRNIELPNKLKKIGKNAFSNTHIITIDIPAKVETIGEYAFRDNKNL